MEEGLALVKEVKEGGTAMVSIDVVMVVLMAAVTATRVEAIVV